MAGKDKRVSTRRKGSQRKQTTPQKGKNRHKAAQLESRSLPAPLLSIIDEHRYVSRLLSILESEHAKLGEGSKELRTIQAIMRYMSSYPDQFHHPKEDLVFDRLSQLDPARKAVTARLQFAHSEISQLGKKLLKDSLDKNILRNTKKFTGFKENIERYASSLRQHMVYEEAHMFEPAAELLSTRDWQTIDDKIAPVSDPVFGSQVAEEFAFLLDNYLSKVLAVSTGNIPKGIPESIGVTLEKSFHIASELVYLPSKILSLHRQGARKQLDNMRDFLRRSNDVGVCETANRMGKTSIESITANMELVYGAFALSPAKFGGSEIIAADHGNIDPADAAGDAPSHKPFTSLRSANISWQAAALNLLLRSTVKPMMHRFGTQYTRTVGALVRRQKSTVANASLERVDGESFEATWVKHKSSSADTKKVIMYLPGGAFYVPATSRHFALTAELSRICDAKVLLVHYRLAPKYVFPSALEDALGAYGYLLGGGIESSDIVFAGDSAGGCLTLSTLLALRDYGLPIPSGAALLSAATDLSKSSPSHESNRWVDPMLATGKSMDELQSYSGNYSITDPLVSPVYGDFAELPPMFAQVGSTEVILDDTLKVARRARDQGIEFEVEVWEGMPHVWQLFSSLPESAQALERIGTFFREVWPAHAA